jgi:hypothetical protein
MDALRQTVDCGCAFRGWPGPGGATYKRGDDETALKTANGDAGFQFIVGSIDEDGHGVPKDDQ